MVFTGIALAIAGFLGGGAIAEAIGAFVVQTIASILTSALVKLITGSHNQAQPAIGVSGKLQAGDDVPRQFPLGIGMTAGSLAYANDWGAAGATPNAYHTDVIALSDLPVKGLLAVMVNGVFVTLDAALTSMGYAVLDYRVSGVDYLWVKFYDGTQTSADTFLTGSVATAARPYGSTRVGYGVAYVICTARSNPQLYTTFPSYRFLLDAVKLYDATKDTTAGGSGSQLWATPSTWGGDGDYLPAVQAYNELRGISYGGAWVHGFQGMGAGRLPNADWIAAIGLCRATITGASGPEPHYRAGGMLTVNATAGDVLDAIMAACAGRIGETGGIYKPMVGAVGSSVASFTDGDILSTQDQSLTMFQSLADTVNSITAQYPEPNAGFAMTALPPLINSALETRDGGRRLPAALNLVNVPYAEQCQRLEKIALNEAQRAIRHTVTLPPSYWGVEPNDIVTYTSTRHGYSSKIFRLDAVLDRLDSHVTVDITELQSTDYDFTTGTDYHAQALRAPVAAPLAAQSVPSFAAAGVTINGGASNQAPAIQLTWDATQINDATAVRWQGRIPSIGTTVVFTGQMVDPGDGVAYVSEGILPNTAYEVRAKPVFPARKSSWTSWVSATTPSVVAPVPSGAVDLNSAQTLSNKSLVDASTWFIDDADGTKKGQFQMSGLTTGTTRTWTWPDASGSVVLTNGTQTISGVKTFNGTLTVDQSTLNLTDATDATKTIKVILSGITTGTQRNLTVPNASGTLLLASFAATISATYTFSAAWLCSDANAYGYTTGAGGNINQATSRTTSVTLNKPTGTVTLFSAAGLAIEASFTLNSTKIGANDLVECHQISGTDDYQVWTRTANGGGAAKIFFKTTGGTTTEQPVFQFNVHKGANA